MLDWIEGLRKLGELKAKGVLSDEEFFGLTALFDTPKKALYLPML